MKRISNISPEVIELSKKCIENNKIDASLYSKYDVKRGLRDINGKGVLTGLTEISDIRSIKMCIRDRYMSHSCPSPVLIKFSIAVSAASPKGFGSSEKFFSLTASKITSGATLPPSKK